MVCISQSTLLYFHLLTKGKTLWLLFCKPTCPNHFSCTSGLLLCKVGIIWAEALGQWFWHPRWLTVVNKRVVNAGWICWTKGWFTFQEGQSGTGRDFIMLLKMMHNLKLMETYSKYTVQIYGINHNEIPSHF
jgi:hypothetical protein